MYDILVYGPVFYDLVFSDLPSMPLLGKEVFANAITITAGGSAIVAAGLEKLGAKVGLITDLGNDSISLQLWEILGDLNIDCSLIRKYDQPLSRVTVSLSRPEDRAFVTHYQHTHKPVDLHTILESNPTQHLHICSYLAALEIPDAPQIARKHNATVSMDPGWDKKALLSPVIREMITNLDIFLPSQIELQKITGSENIAKAAEITQNWMPDGILVVKQSSLGSTCFTNEEKIHVPSISVTSADTTGAGDAFAAGFLYAYLQKQPLTTCLKYGNVCGGLTTTEPGGTQGFPDRRELESWL